MAYDEGPNAIARRSAAAYRGQLTQAAAPRKAPMPPVSRTGDNFISDQGKEISYVKAIHALHARAYADAAAKAKQKLKAKKNGAAAGGFNIPQPTFTPPPPPILPPIVNPYQAVIAGIGGQVQQAQGRVGTEQRQAQAALAGLGATTEVPGASVGDIGSAASSSIAGTGSDLSGNLRAQMAQFIVQQIQNRQQIQADYLKQAQSAQSAFQQQNQFTPDTLRQLIAAGIDPNSVDLNNPFAIAATLGKAQQKKGQGGLSLSTITQLTQAGIDYHQYENDPEGAAVALGKTRKGPSDSLLLKLAKAANG